MKLKKKTKINRKKNPRSTKARPKKRKKPADQPAEVQFRERRLGDIPQVERHPAREYRKYNDTLPLPFGGEVKKDAMRADGLFH